MSKKQEQKQNNNTDIEDIEETLDGMQEKMEKMEKIIERNFKLNRKMAEMMKDIKSYVVMQKIWGMVKILIIVVPILLAYLYLPPLMKDFVNKWQNLIGLDNSVQKIENFLNIKQ